MNNQNLFDIDKNYNWFYQQVFVAICPFCFPAEIDFSIQIFEKFLSTCLKNKELHTFKRRLSGQTSSLVKKVEAKRLNSLVTSARALHGFLPAGFVLNSTVYDLK